MCNVCLGKDKKSKKAEDILSALKDSTKSKNKEEETSNEDDTLITYDDVKFIAKKVLKTKIFKKYKFLADLL